MRGTGDQKLSSFRRRSLRRKLTPQLCGSSLRNLTVRNGILISAYHPCSAMRVRTSQMPSQFVLFSRPSFATCESNFAPAGLVEKM
jgi:hypothetical protein